MDTVTILGYILAPVTAAVTWLFARRKQRNDFLKDLQASIDLLAAKNKTLLDEVVQLREENIQLRTEVTAMREDNKRLTAEVEELNRRLENWKT